MSKWVAHLNPEQQEAALHDFGPLLILAGAGSGKTTVLVSRTGRMIDEEICLADQICVLTFTNKAARELQHRVKQKIGDRANHIWAGTFHSFGLQVLRQFFKYAGLPKSFGLMDQSDSGALVKELLRNYNDSGKTAFDNEKLVSIMSTWRERGQTQAKSEDPYEIASEWLLPKYIRKMEILGVTDFEGLILKPIEMFRAHPDILERVQHKFKQVMVDEFQDTNQAQLDLVRLLSQTHLNVTVVGDDDQSIYGWRGACVKNILDFPHMFDACKVVRLERNYRSTPAILSVANAVITKNDKRHGKTLRSDPNALNGSKPELFVFESEDLEGQFVTQEIQRLHADGVPYKDIAILYRSNSQGALLESELRQGLIPYSLTGGTAFFDRKEIKDVLAFLKSSIAPHEVSLRRIINVPARGVGDTSVDRLAAFAEVRSMTFSDAVNNHSLVDLPEGAHTGLDHLLDFLGKMPTLILREPVEEANQRLLAALVELGYRKYIDHLHPQPIVAAQRWRLVEILCEVMVRYLKKHEATRKGIRKFVDAMLLRDFTNDEDDDKSQVQLLTFHACKGLEYPYVIMVGIEEDIIPHRRLGQDISEERRLFYVAVTRAKTHLVLTRAQNRQKYGRLTKSAPSRFLEEIPKDLLTVYENGARPLDNSERKSRLDELKKKIETNRKLVT